MAALSDTSPLGKGFLTGKIDENAKFGLDANIGAVSVELTPDDPRSIAAASEITVRGTRYPKSWSK